MQRDSPWSPASRAPTPAPHRGTMRGMSMRRCALLLLLSVLAGCSRPTPLVHEAYVWQRTWNDPVLQAVRDAPLDYAGLRVLALERDAAGVETVVSPTLPALVGAALPVVLVARIDGARPPSDGDALATRLATLADAWTAAGVKVVGVELDHDCATAALAEYTATVAAVRAKLPGTLRLSLTALPTWLESPALAGLVAAADETVLQVHAVERPERGLFDAGRAESWIRRYGERAAKSFRTALPAYATRVTFGDSGTAVSAASESDNPNAGANARQLVADPKALASLLQALREKPVANLAGIAWFRLPTTQDRRAYRSATLHALIHGLALDGRPAVEFRGDGNSRALDLVLGNAGGTDILAPAAIRFDGDCITADGAGGYALDPAGGALRLRRPDPMLLAPGAKLAVGWVRCRRGVRPNAVFE